MSRACKRVISLCLVLLFSAFLVVKTYAIFPDITSHWAEEVIIKWAARGIVKGVPDGSFRPDASITRAEFVTIIDSVMNFVNKSDEQFIDVPSNEWYADKVAKSVAAGVTVGIGNNMFGPSNNITRQEAAVMLYRAFNIQVENQSASDKFVDSNQIALWAKDAVDALVQNKYILGRPGNRFAPNENITRAEALKIIDNILDDIISTSGTYSNNTSKGLLVNTKDVLLKDMIIEGNLYISEGVDDGNVVLDGVVIKGDLVISGGGENSITLNNTQVEGTMYVIKYDGRIKVLAHGNTVINYSQILSGVKLVEENVTSTGFNNVQIIMVGPGESVAFDGDFDLVTVDAAGVSVKVESGVIGTLNISDRATGSSIEIQDHSTINMMHINASSTIKGSGTIDKAEIEANHVSIETKPDSILIYKGYIANIGGEAIEGDYVPGMEDIPTPTPTKAPTTAGGATGGGNSDDDDPIQTPQISPSEIYITIGGKSIKGVLVDKNTAELDLSSFGNSKRVSSIEIVANPQDAELETSKVNSIPINKKIKNISNIPVSGLLGTGKESVSLGTIRGVFGDTVTITGTLKKSGYDNLNVSLKINLGAEPGLYPSEYLELTIDGNVITAVIKTGKENVKLSEVGINVLMKEFFGTTPDQVSIDNVKWYSVADQSEDIKKMIAELVGTDTNWSEVTLDDLANKQVFFKKTETGSTVFTINIEK